MATWWVRTCPFLIARIDPTADHGQIGFLLKCTLITMAILTIFRLVESEATIPGQRDSSSDQSAGLSENELSIGTVDPAELCVAPQAAMPRTPLHQRLPERLGDDIVSLQAQDHYVDITTSSGHELVLMRLTDAEREVQALPGLRVHRSWWIAQSHISTIERDGDRVTVLLDTGTQVPVSRSRVSALRKVLAQRGLGADRPNVEKRRSEP